MVTSVAPVDRRGVSCLGGSKDRARLGCGRTFSTVLFSNRENVDGPGPPGSEASGASGGCEGASPDPLDDCLLRLRPIVLEEPPIPSSSDSHRFRSSSSASTRVRRWKFCGTLGVGRHVRGPSSGVVGAVDTDDRCDMDPVISDWDDIRLTDGLVEDEEEE